MPKACIKTSKIQVINFYVGRRDTYCRLARYFLLVAIYITIYLLLPILVTLYVNGLYVLAANNTVST